MSVEVINETDYRVDLAEFSALGEYVLEQMHVGSGVDLNILFIDEIAMADLHEKWLQLPGPTDVMSFPMDELRPGTPTDPSGPGILGDVCVCPTVAQKQARAAGHSQVEEMLLLTTHGILHLLGYDHADAEQEKEMFALQRQLLLTFLAKKAEDDLAYRYGEALRSEDFGRGGEDFGF